MNVHVGARCRRELVEQVLVADQRLRGERLPGVLVWAERFAAARGCWEDAEHEVFGRLALAWEPDAAVVEVALGLLGRQERGYHSEGTNLAERFQRLLSLLDTARDCLQIPD